MRLWHIDILEFLPRTQLLAQWRELNSIFAKEDKHVLINYIYEYDKIDLYAYSLMVINQFSRRGYNIRSFEKMDNYFKDFNERYYEVVSDIFKRHHNKEYLQICYFNLKEKFIRGQKDYSKDEFTKLREYYNKVVKA